MPVATKRRQTNTTVRIREASERLEILERAGCRIENHHRIPLEPLQSEDNYTGIPAMTSILFICSGNIFRSMVAEYALKSLLGSSSSYIVGSAGIEALPATIHPLILDHLLTKGSDPSNHVQRKLTQNLLDEVTLPVAMGLNHHEFIRQHFNRDVLLFNEICFQTREPILDLHEAIPDWQRNLDAAHEYVISVIDYIWDTMPIFLATLPERERRAREQT
jgi:protein-tyrosine phosphatase